MEFGDNTVESLLLVLWIALARVATTRQNFVGLLLLQ